MDDAFFAASNPSVMSSNTVVLMLPRAPDAPAAIENAAMEVSSGISTMITTS